jgi:hypothetical protein
MPISSRQFFTTKPTVIEYVTLEIHHPAYGFLRFVGNQYTPKTLGGVVYQPAAMVIKEAIQDSRNTISYEVQLGRIGSQVKPFIKAVKQYPLGWVIPMVSKVSYWLSNDINTPYRPIVELSIGNLVIDGDSVAFTLDTANPRGQSVARRYNGVDFPGTKAKI